MVEKVITSPAVTETGIVEEGKQPFLLGEESKNLLQELFPKKGKVSVAPPTETAHIPSPSPDSNALPLLSFEAMIEEISLKIWTLIRSHLKQMNLFQEDLENVYKASIKAQVRSYLSWTGTALQIAGVATSACSLGVQLCPQKIGNALMKTNLLPEWHKKFFQGEALDLKGFSEAAGAALQSISNIFGNTSKIHDNYAQADRTGASGQGQIAYGRSDLLQKEIPRKREELESVLQMIKKRHEDDAATRRAIGPR